MNYVGEWARVKSFVWEQTELSETLRWGSDVRRILTCELGLWSLPLAVYVFMPCEGREGEGLQPGHWSWCGCSEKELMKPVYVRFNPINHIDHVLCSAVFLERKGWCCSLTVPCEMVRYPFFAVHFLFCQTFLNLQQTHTQGNVQYVTYTAAQCNL